MNKKYKILLFDLDDTLLDFSADEKIAIRTVLENHGLFTGEDIIEMYYTIEDWQTFKLGDITAKTVITSRFCALLKIFGVENTEIMVDEYYTLMQKSHKVISGALALLKRLNEKGYLIYLATNGYAQFQYPRIKASKLSKYFKDIFISEEIDLRKPSPSFYKYVLDRVPVSNKSDVLIIGDAQTADILGGINSGIDTCWYNPEGRVGRYKPTYEIKSYKDLEKIL